MPAFFTRFIAARRYGAAVVALVLAAVLAGCGGRSTSVPASGTLVLPAPPSAAQLGLPPALPALPVPKLPSGARAGRGPVTAARAQTSFFNGEVALTNGVYFLRFANSNVFGYYGYYTPDPHFVYHFDLSNGDPVNGWAYAFDSPDPAHPEYAFFYDFQSAHYWYTTAANFPYLYDFTLGAWLYYFPDAGDATHTHYTTKPRYFSNLTTGAIITIPSPVVSPPSLSFSALGQGAVQQMSVSEPGYSGALWVDATACGAKISVTPAAAANTFAVTPLAAGACNLIVTDEKGLRAGVSVAVSGVAPTPSPTPTLPTGALSAGWVGNGSFAAASGPTVTVLPSSATKAQFGGNINFAQAGQSVTVTAVQTGGPAPAVGLGYFSGEVNACTGHVTLTPSGPSTYLFTAVSGAFTNCALIVTGSPAYGNLEIYYFVTGPVPVGGGVS